jgi:hypothetical protein
VGSNGLAARLAASHRDVLILEGNKVRVLVHKGCNSLLLACMQPLASLNLYAHVAYVVVGGVVIPPHIGFREPRPETGWWIEVFEKSLPSVSERGGLEIGKLNQLTMEKVFAELRYGPWFGSIHILFPLLALPVHLTGEKIRVFPVPVLWILAKGSAVVMYPVLPSQFKALSVDLRTHRKTRRTKLTLIVAHERGRQVILGFRSKFVLDLVEGFVNNKRGFMGVQGVATLGTLPCQKVVPSVTG